MKKPLYITHLFAYLWAAQYVGRRKILDLGCGDGYGLQLLSIFAEQVHGVDNDERRIERAKSKDYYCSSEISEIDLNKGKIPQGFDVCIAFEVLEHLDKPEEVCAQVLEQGKTLIFSLPYNYPHELHKHVFTTTEQIKSLFPGFDVDFLYLKGITVRTTPIDFDRFLGIATPKKQESLENLYDKRYFKKSIRFQMAKWRMRSFIQAIETFKPHSVLDVGSGLGYLVRHLRKRGIDAHGIDFARTLQEDYALTEPYFHNGDAKSLPFPDKSFDLVFSSDFFEHIPEQDINTVYNEMKRVSRGAVLARIDFERELLNGVQATYHCTNKPKEWWQEKLPGCFLI